MRATRPGTGRPTRGEQMSLIGAGTILLVGVFSDGWAHRSRLDELEGFLTPWHGIVFAGYLACLAVVVRAIVARLEGAEVPAPRLSLAVPAGWRPAVAGVALFAAGFLGDGLWHTAFGIEADLEALLSPTHLIMLLGVLSIFAAPISVEWRSPTPRHTTLRALGPALGASTIVASSAAFFLLYAWHIGNGFLTAGFLEEAQPMLTPLGRTAVQVWAILSYYVTTLVMVAPALLLLRRWRLPPGALTILLLVPQILLLAMHELEGWQRMAGMLAAAAAGEALLDRTDPSPARPLAARMLAAVLPLVAFSVDMLVVGLVWGHGWPPELVSGAVLSSALLGAGLGFLAFPPRDGEEARQPE